MEYCGKFDHSGSSKGAQVDRPDTPEESMHDVILPPIDSCVADHTSGNGITGNHAGGLYRLGNGYLSCPEVIPMTNGQPNLSGCT